MGDLSAAGVGPHEERPNARVRAVGRDAGLLADTRRTHVKSGIARPSESPHRSARSLSLTEEALLGQDLRVPSAWIKAPEWSDLRSCC